jgi:hypothetical protein
VGVIEIVIIIGIAIVDDCDSYRIDAIIIMVVINIIIIIFVFVIATIITTDIIINIFSI